MLKKVQFDIPNWHLRTKGGRKCTCAQHGCESSKLEDTHM